MSRSLSVAIFCGVVLGVLGLAGCKGDGGETPPNNPGGGGGLGGVGNMGGSSGVGDTGGSSGVGDTGGSSGVGDTGGTGVTGGVGGMGVTGGSGGMGGGDGGGDGSSWTHLGYDPSNTYYNPLDKTISAANAAMLEEKWVFPVQDGAVVHGGVIIADGKVFATSSAGVYAINLADGTQAWHRPELVADSSAAYADGAVFIHTQPAELYKLDAATGDTLFGPVKTYNLAGADGTSSPVVANGKVVVGHSAGTNEVGPTAATSFGGVEAFSSADLSAAWTYNTCEGSENGAMTWSTVTIDVAANVVYASTGNNYTIGGPNSDAIHAIDLGTGDGLWKKQVREGDVWSLFGAPGGEDTDFGSNPILAQIGDNKVVAAGDKASAFWVLDRDDGMILHTKADLTGSHTPNFGGVLNNGAYDGETFYVIANDATPMTSKLFALNQDGLTDKWAPISYSKIVWGMPALANGVLYAPINDTLEVIDAANGTTLKSFPLAGTVAAGSPAIAAGRVVVKAGMTYGFAGGTAIPNNKIYCFGLPD